MDATPSQQNSGAASVSSSAALAVSLAGGATTASDSHLVVAVIVPTPQLISPTPTGWSKITDTSGTSGARLYVFRRGPVEGLVAGESSWSFSMSSATATPCAWVVLDYPGLDPDAPVDYAPGVGAGTSTTSGTTSVNTSGLTSTYNGLVMSFHGSYLSTGATVDTWGSHTGGFAELVEQGAAGASTSVDVSVSALPVQSLGQYGATATCSRTMSSASPGSSLTVVFTAANARKAADLLMVDGAEQGSVTGLTISPGGWRPVDSLAGTVTCDAAAARSGSYGWRLVGSAAAANFGWSGSIPGGISLASSGGTRTVWVRHWRLPSALGADTVLLTLAGTGVSVVVRYIAATGKIGVKVGSGTEQVSDQAVTANQWFRTDLRLDTRTTAVTCDWTVTYNAELTSTSTGTAQTQATGTGTTATGINTITVGPTAAGTFEIHTDDGAASNVAGHYPLGDIRVVPVKVDPAGTPVVTGTVGNFGVMTANGTVTALTAGTLANARNALDDIPPDLSATRDAAVAVTASATDWLDFPMDTYNAATNGTAVRAVRVICCLWAASATAATIRIRASDGTTTYTLYSEADPNADNTATPVWMASMVRGTVRTDWTQAKLDALTVGFGSNDATPDIGIDAILAEVAVKAGQSQTVFGSAGDVQVTASADPDSAGIISLTTQGADYKGTQLSYDVSGTPTNVTVARSGSRTDTIGAPDAPTVDYVAIYPDPEGVADA